VKAGAKEVRINTTSMDSTSMTSYTSYDSSTTAQPASAYTGSTYSTFGGARDASYSSPVTNFSSNNGSSNYSTAGSYSQGAWTTAADEKFKKKESSSGGFVGLCNQGATCYMNSLIQALYMTPEFRKALYDWEYNEEFYINPDRCIPYQLQKLFALLQFSERQAVETKGLTASFGWEGADAFAQHDVQELCRVLFDALEVVFKGSPLETTIADLFEGTSMDYVRCHGCGHESARPDKFMDLSLVIRPFGASPEDYNKSVTEAIAQYIKPEILDGDNKYACDACGKRCDADKGLKLVRLPYILMFQIKRFDFDFETMRRMKINDKMQFPEVLDLTDSVALEEGDEKKELKYQLYGVLIHSGSALAGHYYSYIRDHSDGSWHEFNDSNVSGITDLKYQDAWGGSKEKSHKSSRYSGYGTSSSYTSSYESSANAYMLLYRQIDPDRNLDVVSNGMIRQEILDIVAEHEGKVQHKKEEAARKYDEIDIKVHYKENESKHTVLRTNTLVELLKVAHEHYKLEDEGFTLENARLRLYTYHHMPGETYVGKEDESLVQLRIYGQVALLLETRVKGEEWSVFDPTALSLRVSLLKEGGTFGEPKHIACPDGATLETLQDKVSETFNVKRDKIRLIKEATYTTGAPDKMMWTGVKKFSGDLKKYHRMHAGDNLYIEVVEKDEDESGLLDAYDSVRNHITIKFNHPDTEATLSTKIDKRRTLGELREVISTLVEIPVGQFRIKDSNKELDMDNKALNAPGVAIWNNTSLVIEKGLSGAVKVDFTLCDKEDLFKFHELFEMEVDQMVTVSNLIDLVAAKLKEKGKAGSPDSSLIRLRDRICDHPGKIFHKGLTLKSAVSYMRDGMEIAVEVVEKPEELKDSNVMLYVQRWHPESYTIGSRFEIAVHADATLTEMKEIYSEASGISIGDLECLHCNMYRALDVLDVPKEEFEDLALKKASVSTYSYNSATPYKVGGSPWFCKDGQLFLVKDKKEVDKVLTAEDKKALSSAKVYSARKTSYSYGGRKESGVKINVTDQVKRRPSLEEQEAMAEAKMATLKIDPS